MPRYLVERTFAGKLHDSALGFAPDEPLRADATALAANAHEGVTWLHSYVTPDRERSFCICDGPSPEAIRLAARSTGLPVDRITEVRVLDPHGFH